MEKHKINLKINKEEVHFQSEGYNSLAIAMLLVIGTVSFKPIVLEYISNFVSNLINLV